jgi:FkbM family methyltransferase
MVVSGFTILRHAGRLGYPFLESIRSVLPLVDEFIAVVADDDRESAMAVEAIGDPRIRVHRSVWHPVGVDGIELARQTNIALQQCTGDWAIYVQADEVIHEEDHEILRRAMRAHLTRDTEGLLFDYLHFFRSYRWIANDWRAFYPRAVRAIRTRRGVESAGDAAGFVARRGGRTRGLIKARSHARIFHYGWAGSVQTRLERKHALRELYIDGPSDLTVADVTERTSLIANQQWALRRYDGTHPSVMLARITDDAEAFIPSTIVRTPPWLRAWASALADPRHFRGWGRALLPAAITNARWRLIDVVNGRRKRHEDQRRAAFYRAFVHPSDLVLDVGANVGTHSRAFRNIGARVVAFEPQRECARLLAAAFDGDQNFTLVEAAISDAEGVADLHVSDELPLSTLDTEWKDRTRRSRRFPDSWHRRERVMCTTLDRSIEKFGVPAFIKIDIEGSELRAIRGLSQPVERLSLEFATESIDRIGQCIDHLDRLAAYEYRLSFGDELRFAGARWERSADIKAQLNRAAVSDPLMWGDLYVRRVR